MTKTPSRKSLWVVWPVLYDSRVINFTSLHLIVIFESYHDLPLMRVLILQMKDQSVVMAICNPSHFSGTMHGHKVPHGGSVYCCSEWLIFFHTLCCYREHFLPCKLYMKSLIHHSLEFLIKGNNYISEQKDSSGTQSDIHPSYLPSETYVELPLQ